MLPLSDLAIFLGVTAIILLYFHLRRNFDYWKKQNVPYEKPTIFFGNIFPICALRTSIAELMYEFHKSTTSRFYGFFVFDKPFLLLRDPELIKRVLVKDFEYFSDRSIIENTKDDTYGKYVLFVVKNPLWRPMRAKITPALASGKIKNMTPLMVDASKDMVEYVKEKIKKNNSLYIRDIALTFTTDVITSTVFGIAANSFKDENAEFRKASKRVFEYNFSRGTQFISLFFAPILVKIFRMKYIDPPAGHFLKKVFFEVLKNREIDQAYRGDLIDVLIQIRNSQTNGEKSNSSDNKIDPFSDDDALVAQAIQFFIAGYETTGSNMFFTLVELALNSSIQDKLRNEIKEVYHKHGELSYDAIQDMKYLDMVVCESLRKFPVVPFMDRRCTKTYKIPDTDVIIQKGMPVYISLFGLHMDPNYFPNPDKFDPERFSPANKSKIPSYTYIPFGEGLHNCIGARFALINGKVGLAALLMNFKVSPSTKITFPIKYNPKGFLLAPNDDIALNFTLCDEN